MLRFVSVQNCNDSTLNLGVVPSHIKIEGCHNVSISVVCRSIHISNCTSTTVYLYALHRPLIFGDCSKVVLAPYNSSYDSLTADLLASRMATRHAPGDRASASSEAEADVREAAEEKSLPSVRDLHMGSNCWSSPIVLPGNPDRKGRHPANLTRTSSTVVESIPPEKFFPSVVPFQKLNRIGDDNLGVSTSDASVGFKVHFHLCCGCLCFWYCFFVLLSFVYFLCCLHFLLLISCFPSPPIFS